LRLSLPLVLVKLVLTLILPVDMLYLGRKCRKEPPESEKPTNFYRTSNLKCQMSKLHTDKHKQCHVVNNVLLRLIQIVSFTLAVAFSWIFWGKSIIN